MCLMLIEIVHPNRSISLSEYATKNQLKQRCNQTKLYCAVNIHSAQSHRLIFHFGFDVNYCWPNKLVNFMCSRQSLQVNTII